MTLLHTEIIPLICKSNNYKLEKIDSNCSKISNNSAETYVYYYEFNCNKNSNSWIARDKPIAYSFLKYNNIPAVEHIYLPHEHALKLSTDYLNTHKQIVLKSTQGTCGRNVFYCTTNESLKKITNSLIKRGVSFCASPYIDYNTEYRVIVFNNKPQLCYSKNLPFVIGDGKSTINQLKEIKYPNLEIPNAINKNKILKTNEKKNLLWKHNLCNGAELSTNINSKLKKGLENLALKCAQALNLEICSIDIIVHNNSLKILEINPGLMMESLYKSSEANQSKALEIYTNVIKHCLTPLYSG